MITRDEIISVMDIVSTKVANTIATNVSINSDGKKNTVKKVIILLLIIIHNFLSLCTSYKTLIGAKPLRIRSDKIGGFIIIYDETRYLAFSGSKIYDAI